MDSGSVGLQGSLHSMTQGGLFRGLQWAFGVMLAVGLLMMYQMTQFKGLDSPEAMELGHLGKQLADGKGFTTQYVRPLDFWMLGKSGNERDFVVRQPEVGHPPLYAGMLAQVFHLTRVSFDFPNGKIFSVFAPEKWMCLFSEIWLLLSVLLFYLTARRLTEERVAVVSAAMMLFCNQLWIHATACTPFTFLLFLSGVVGHAVVRLLEDEGRLRSVMRVALAALAIGAGFWVKYRFILLLLPLLTWMLACLQRKRLLHAATAVLLVSLVAAPWIQRNLKVTGLPLGRATYALQENSDLFPGRTLEEQVKPKLEGFGFGNLRRKWMVNARVFFETEAPLLGGNFAVFFFVTGLLFAFKSERLQRLRQFCLITFGWLILTLPFIGNSSGGANSGNFYVLMVPWIFLFGTVFFFVLVDRWGALPRSLNLILPVVFVLVNSISLIFALLPPRPPPFRYPPYFPPTINLISSWMQPDELMMSDMPWAVAWYGNVSCLPLTKDIPSFLEINDYTKKISGIFLTPLTSKQKLSDIFRDGDSWGVVLFSKTPPSFPLRVAAPGLGGEFYFVTDRVRWQPGGG